MKCCTVDEVRERIRNDCENCTYQTISAILQQVCKAHKLDKGQKLHKSPRKYFFNTKTFI